MTIPAQNQIIESAIKQIAKVNADSKQRAEYIESLIDNKRLSIVISDYIPAVIAALGKFDWLYRSDKERFLAAKLLSTIYVKLGKEEKEFRPQIRLVLKGLGKFLFDSIPGSLDLSMNDNRSLRHLAEFWCFFQIKLEDLLETIEQLSNQDLDSKTRAVFIGALGRIAKYQYNRSALVKLKTCADELRKGEDTSSANLAWREHFSRLDV